MKLTWLEDFLALLDAGTFSAAARRRMVTQPAFSRRIRMLESWLGVDLVERRGHRSAPTATALRFRPELQAVVSQTYDLRNRLRAHASAERRMAITTQHTLMITHLPGWLERFQAWEPHTAFHVRTGDSEECRHQLDFGGADLMIAYEADAIEAEPPEAAGTTERWLIDREALVPVATPPRAARAEGRAMRILNYPERSFLGRVVRTYCLPDLVKVEELDTVCESAFAVGLKEMCLAGMGVAWLPRALVARELERGELHCLADRLPSPSLSVAAVRRRDNPNAALGDVWQRLTKHD